MSGRITEASALLALREYYLENDKFPKAYECNASNGLPHYTTYLRIYNSWSAAVTAAREYVSAPGSAISALFALATKRCMKCGDLVRDPSKAVRHCNSCRREIFSDDDYEEYLAGGVVSVDMRNLDWESM